MRLEIATHTGGSRTSAALALALAVFFGAGVAGAAEPGVIVCVGPVPELSGVPTLDADAVAAALRLQPPSAPPAPAERAVLDTLRDAQAVYWEKGRTRAALAALREGRAALTNRVAAADRPAAVEALWLLAQLLLQAKPPQPAEADDVLDHGLRVDPAASPGIDAFTAPLIAAYAARRKRYLASARHILVRMTDGPAEACSVWVDGVERGALDRALGPFPRGGHRVRVACGARSSWTHAVTLAESDAQVVVRGWELDLTLAPGGLGLPDAAHVAAVERHLLASGTVDWVLSVADASDGAVSCRLNRRGASSPATESVLAASVAGWLSTQTSRPIGQDPPPPTSLLGPGPTWWHWTTIGAGAALIVAGGIVHHQGLVLADDLNAGISDRFDDVGSYEDSSIALYAIGGGVLAVGTVLAVLSARAAPSKRATLIPGPGTLSLHVRF